MLLTLFACSSRAGSDAREFAMHYSGRGHLDSNVFKRLHQCLFETGSVAPKALLNANAHGLYGHQPMQMPQLQPWQDTRYRKRIWNIPIVFFEVLLEDQLYPLICRGTHICSHTIVLYPYIYV